jgi:hypothetical protein
MADPIDPFQPTRKITETDIIEALDNAFRKAQQEGERPFQQVTDEGIKQSIDNCRRILELKFEQEEMIESWMIFDWVSAHDIVPGFVAVWYNPAVITVDTEIAKYVPADQLEEAKAFFSAKTCNILFVDEDHPPGTAQYELTTEEADQLGQTLRTFVAIDRDPQKGKVPPG